MTVPSKMTAVRKAAQELRVLAIKTPEGTLLGSEDDLLARLQVSRPTLRHAAGLVAQEQLITVRRGVGGGYFASRPNTMAVAHMAAIYLQTHKATLEEVIHAVGPIRIELARLATRNREPQLLSELNEFLLREVERSKTPIQYRTFLKSQREMGEILSRMSNNKVLSLFLDILYDYASMLSREDDVYVNRPDRIEKYRSERNRLARAIHEGDEDVAVLAATRCTMAVTEWLMEDLQHRQGGARKADAASSPIRSGARRRKQNVA